MPIYEYQCNKCSRVWESYSTLPHDVVRESCQKCDGIGERIYSLSVPKVFPVFTTRNILPGGKEVTVRGPGQLRQLEAEHGVKMADGGPPPQTAFPDPS